MAEACLFPRRTLNLSHATGEPGPLFMLNWILWEFVLVCYYTSNAIPGTLTRFLCPMSKPTFHYVLWAQHYLLIMQYQSLIWYKSIVFTSESYLVGFQIVLFHLTLLFLFWDMLFSAPLFPQIAITRIFLYMPHSFLHFYFYSYNSKRALSKFPNNIPNSTFLFSVPELGLHSSMWYFSSFSLPWLHIILFLFHSPLATASQSSLISVCLVHIFVLVPLSPLSTLWSP